MKTKGIVVFLTVLVGMASTSWGVPVVYEQTNTYNIHMGDEGSSPFLLFGFSHTLAPEVDPTMILSAEIIIDTAKVNAGTGSPGGLNAVYMVLDGTDPMDSTSWVKVGELRTNWNDWGLDTTLEFDPGDVNLILLAMDLQNDGEAKFLIESAFLGFDGVKQNHEDMDIISSTFRLVWDDQTQIQALPEPATILLTIGGLAGIAGLRRRRR